MKTSLRACALIAVTCGMAWGQKLQCPPPPTVLQLYQNVLLRQPEPSGLAFWLANYTSGSDMVDRFMTSDEFIHNGFTVMAALTNLLGRMPTYAEWTSAVPLWESNTQGTWLFTITDALKAQSNPMYAALIYYTLVRRDPDSGGFSFLEGIMASTGPGLLFSSQSQTRKDIISMLLGPSACGL